MDFNGKRVLVVRNDSVGDQVLNLPFIREFKKNWPDVELHYICRNYGSSLTEDIPLIDHHMKFSGISDAILKIKQFDYDAVVAPRWDINYFGELECIDSANAPIKVGYGSGVNPRKQASDPKASRVFTHLVDSRPGVVHEVERNLDVIRFMGGRVSDLGAYFYLDDPLLIDSSRIALDKEFGWFEDGRLKVVLFLGAGAPMRKWPIINFVNLASELKKSANCRIFVLPSNENDEDVAKFKSLCKPGEFEYFSPMALDVMGYILRHCDLFVSNDTGPMHIAAAVGCRVVEVSTHPKSGDKSWPNAPERFGPWSDSPSRVIQPEKGLDSCSSHCTMKMAHCIRQIKVDRVFGAAMDLMEEKINGQ